MIPPHSPSQSVGGEPASPPQRVIHGVSPRLIEVQGHRGARGARPGNTLPAFEMAVDAGVDSIETDVHLSRDGVLILHHDPLLTPANCYRLDGACVATHLLSSLTLAELRQFRVRDDAARFPQQSDELTPLARRCAQSSGINPFTLPTLDDLLTFLNAYAGPEGGLAGKSDEARQRARNVVIDLEVKRVPFHPECIGDDFGQDLKVGRLSRLEELLLATIQQANRSRLVRVRSFDHRAVALLKQHAADVETAILTAATAPLDPGKLSREAGADVYCPDYRFVDEHAIRKAHEAGVRVIPWTVNTPQEWRQLLAWHVDGITTDYPELLLQWLKENGFGNVGMHGEVDAMDAAPA